MLKTILFASILVFFLYALVLGFFGRNSGSFLGGTFTNAGIFIIFLWAIAEVYWVKLALKG